MEYQRDMHLELLELVPTLDVRIQSHTFFAQILCEKPPHLLSHDCQNTYPLRMKVTQNQVHASTFGLYQQMFSSGTRFKTGVRKKFSVYPLTEGATSQIWLTFDICIATDELGSLFVKLL